jgi:anti-sigma B factor antagonist
MQVTTRDTGDAVVLTLEGRLVLEDVEAELRGAIDGLIEQGRVRLVLNLRDVAYIDSAGLGFLVSKYVSAHRRGGHMALVGVTPRVAHVLAITRLSQVFEVFASEDEAVRAVVLMPAHAPTDPFTSTLR